MVRGGDSKIALRFERRARLWLAGDFRQRVCAVAAGAFEKRTDLDGQSLVQDRAFHMACAGELNLPCTDDALHTAANRAFLGDDLAFAVDRQFVKRNAVTGRVTVGSRRWPAQAVCRKSIVCRRSGGS